MTVESPWFDVGALRAETRAWSLDEMAHRIVLNSSLSESAVRASGRARRRPRLDGEERVRVGFDGSRSAPNPIDGFVLHRWTPPGERRGAPQRAPAYVDDDGTVVQVVTTLPGWR